MKTIETAQRIYEYTITGPLSKQNNFMQWDWYPGVAMISILDYYQVTQDKNVVTFLECWVKENFEKAELCKVINSMAPFAIFPELYEITKNEFYLEQAINISHWLIEEAPRTREGAFEHTVTEDAQFPEQVWADTIFMAGLLLARTARVTQKEEFSEQAIEQVLIHLRLLQDRETGVLFHGWNCVEQNHMSAARWTRANAWIAVAVPEIIREVQGLVDIPEEIIQRYTSMMKGLQKYQMKDGLWHTVMDQPDFYPETSGSAGIACGMLKANRIGLIDSSYLQSAALTLETVIASKINSDGGLSGVSRGTPVMPTIEAYNQIVVGETLYGQALALMLLLEWTRKV